MKVIICNKKSLIRAAKQNYADLKVKSDDPAVISIRDCGDDPLPISDKPKRFLSLEFDDVVPGDDEGVPISDAQAQSIAEFVFSCRDEIRVLVCQCTFGQSRSAAVAAAVAEYFNGNGIKIFADDRYCPNKNVFRKVFKALQRTGKIVVLDVETSGFDPERDHIIKITAVKIENVKRIEKFSSLVNCSEPLSPKVESLTGITNEMLSAAPPLGEVILQLKDFCYGYTLVAEEAPFVEKFLSRYGFENIRNVDKGFFRKFGFADDK